MYILPLGPCKCPPNANCRGASAANNGQHLPLLPAFLREIFFFFPKKGSSHSDRSDCSGSSAHRCFKAPTMPQTMHATLFVFPSTLHNTEPISAAVKGKKKKKSSGDQNTHPVWEGSNTLISVYYKQELHPHPSTSPQGDEFSPAVMSCQVADFFLISPCWESYSSVCTQG